jgi:hypothetical protein
MQDPGLARAHLLLAELGELDAYLRLTSDGALSDRVRLIEESLEGKLGRSVVIVAAAPRPEHLANGQD